MQVENPVVLEIVQFFEDLRMFTFHNGENIGLAGSDHTTYKISVIATTGTDGEQEIQLASSFSLVVKNPCIDPTYVTIDDYNLYDE